MIKKKEKSKISAVKKHVHEDIGDYKKEISKDKCLLKLLKSKKKK